MGGGGEMKTPRLATGLRLGLAAALGGALALALALFLLVPQNAQADGVSVGTKGIVLSWHTISLKEGSTTAAEVMVRLGTQPSDTVRVALNGGANSNAAGATCANSHKLCIDSPPGGTKSNTSLIFTTSTWDTPQTVDLYGQDDSDKLDESITLTLTPVGGGYGSSEAATIAVTIRDDDKNQFVFTGLTDSNRAIEVDEGTSTSTFTVKLSDNPASDVTVALTSSNSAVSVSPASLTFSTTAGTTAQTVTITAGSDPNTDDETYYLRLKPSGSDDTRTRGYSIAVTVDDDDTENDLTVSETSLSLNESGSGNTDTFTVALVSAPAAGKDVTVAIGVHGANGKSIATPDKNKLTFTSSTYNTAQTVTITGVVDRDSINETGTVRVTASQDGPFAGLSRSMTLTVTDNSSDLGINVFHNSQRLTEITTGPATLTAKVSLSAKPAANVTVTSSVSPSGTLTAQFGGSSSATFTPANWDVPQDLTITTGNNFGTDYTITLTATGSAEYASKTQVVKVWTAAAPTVRVHGLNPDNSFLVTFSRASGSCATVTESICSGSVTQFTATTVVNVLELVVGTTDLAVADDGTLSQDTGTKVPFVLTKTSSNNQFNIRPTIPEGASTLKMLVKDRYWGVDGGVQGERMLHTIKLNHPGQATATLQRVGSDGVVDATTWLTVRIDDSKAKGEASNDWTLVPVQGGWGVSADDATKELRVGLGTSKASYQLGDDINAVSGFTVVGYGGFNQFAWLTSDVADLYSNIKFSGGFDIWEYSPPRLTNSAPTVANAIADQTVALGERIDVPLAGVFADADGDTLLYSATSSDTSVATTYLFGNSTLRLSGKALGTATITVTATDGRWVDGLAPRSRTSVTDTFTVTVSTTAPTPTPTPPPSTYTPPANCSTATQATARIVHVSNSNDYIEVRIDSSIAKGTDGNSWTLRPVQGNSQGSVTPSVDSANKRLVITFHGGSYKASIISRINNLSGFTVTGSSGNPIWRWRTTDSSDWYSDVSFTGGTCSGVGNSPPPDNNDPNDPPPPVLLGLVLGGNSDPDFDGQTLEVQHVTDDSTACLDVQWGNASNGQDVQTWECNNTNAQQWTFEKRTAGDYAGSYRLVSKLGNYCLDNRGDFTTSSRMGIWSCVDDNHSAAANQSVAVAASGEGYTLTFSNGSSSVWLTTDRASDDPEGSAGQTTVSGSAGANAIWRISATKVSWVPPSVVLTWAPPSVSYSNAPASPDAPITQSGTHGPDDLSGAGGDDVLSGGRGDDVLRGLGGDDALYGDSGDDELLGGEGDDELDGGSGDDTYTGGAGADRFVFSPDGPGDKIITDFDASEGDVIVLSAAPPGRPWPSVADIVASVAAQGDVYTVYTLHDGLTVETDTPLRVGDFVE